MKVVHLADTHLGYSAYRKISESGYNQREEDVILAFIDAVDKVVNMRPDVVLHCGDLFDSVRPTNRIVSIGIKQLMRIYDAGIPLVMISGNHETPKQLYKGSIYSIFEALPLDKKLFNIVYTDKYESFVFGNLTVHAVPQCENNNKFKAELDKIVLNPATKNVLMLHTGVTGMKEFSHGESNELLIDYEWLNASKFDYVAIGHYHNCVKVAKNSWFCGSSERMSFNEAGSLKGFLEVDLAGEAKTNLIKTRIRPMIDMPAFDASGKDSVVLLEEIIKSIEKVEPAGKIIRMTIKNIPQHVMNALDTKKIREAAKDAVHFEPRYEKINEEGNLEEVKILSGGIKEEFRAFLETSKELDEKDRDSFYSLWSQEYDSVVKEEEEQKS
jgi:DNA repair exonuclease SbcCD nuclease subunit